MTSKEKVINVLNGKVNEVQPCFDIIRNDSIVEYIPTVSEENRIKVMRGPYCYICCK